MRKVLKKSACLLTAVALSATMVALPAAAEEAHAAEKPHMKKIGVKFDLKKNKAATFKTSWPGAGFKKMTATVRNLKITNAKKKGYKKATFTVVMRNKFSPTKKQIKAMRNWDGDWNITWGNCWVAIVDYATGRQLVDGNKQNVTVRYGKWKFTGDKTYKNKWGGSVHLFKTASVKVTVTYPSNYKNLCIGVGGDNTHHGTYGVDQLREDPSIPNKVDLFWVGEAPFGKTELYNWKLMYDSYLSKSNFYTKSKTNSHWMRIK